MQSILSFYRIPLVVLSLALLLLYSPAPQQTLLLLVPTFVFLYIITGGWKFLRIVWLTGGRDMQGLKSIVHFYTKMRGYVRDHQTIVTIFDEVVEKHHDKAAFLFEDFKWTFCDVSRYANAIAHFLTEREKSLNKGDVVALFMETRPEYVATWLGIVKKGCVAALINFNQRKSALIHSLKIAKVKSIVVGEELLPAVVEVADDLDKSITVYVIPKSEGSPSCRITKGHVDVELPTGRFHCEALDMSTIEQYFDHGAFQSPKMAFTDIILYIYTSGTTGLPKAAKISTSRMWYMATANHYMPGMSDDEVFYVSLPIYHSNGGLIGVGQALIFGCTVVLRKKFSASQFWDDCVKYKCTAFMYIGEICRYLLSQPVRPAESQHRIRYAVGNGMRASIWSDFQNRFGIKQIVEFYGATEGNANSINYSNKVGAVGFTSVIAPWAYPIFLIKVVESTNQPIRDMATGLCIRCEPGEPGELVGRIVEGNALRRFDGYATAAETERKIVRNVLKQGDMFFRTGDILTMDELGFLYFKDRTGDTFRWRGENVSTQEVEAAVSKATGLRDAAVYGVEVPGVEGRAGMVAMTDPKNELDITNGLASTLFGQLPSYGVPMFLRVMEEIPSTGTFKYVKGSLQKQAFNPELTGKDPLYYLDMSSNPRRYVPLTGDVYRKILAGEIRI